MIQPEIAKLVSEIHASPQRFVLEFAGAGSLALFWLHSQAGSSRTVLEAVDRYAALSTIDLLGAEPKRFVTKKTARLMAVHAYQRALRLSSGTAPVIGVGCSATIATDRRKRGKHTCRVCVIERNLCTQYALTFEKGTRERFQEENIVSKVIMAGIAKACGLEPGIDLNLQKTEPLKIDSSPYKDPLDSLLAEEMRTINIVSNGHMQYDQIIDNVAVLSGAFNPMHAGHTQLARAAATHLRREVVFELPVINADKGALSHSEICQRLAQFQNNWRLLLTRQPLFANKAVYFRNSVFIVGYDTALRLLQSRYYHDNKAELRAALTTIRNAGCRFLVAGRIWKEKFCQLTDLSIPSGFSDMFEALPEDNFRVDTSSTEARKRRDTTDAKTSHLG